MGRICTICVHPASADINSALETNRPLRDIAAEFGVSKTALHRHWKAHTSAEPAPQPVESGTAPGMTATKQPPAILKWVVIGGIGFVAGWRIRAGLRE
jgi:hypothetical protein